MSDPEAAAADGRPTELPGTTVRRVDVFGARYAVHRADPARGRRTTPSLLLHGLPMTSVHFRHLLPELGTDRTVLAPDLKALGDSRGGPPYDPQTCAHELAAVLRDQVGDRRVDVVGHDWGGLLAVALATYRPDLVRRLVLVGAPTGFGDAMRMLPVPLLALPLLSGLALRAAGAGAIRAIIRSGWVAGEPGEELLDGYAAAYAEPGRVAALTGYVQHLVHPRLGRYAQLVLRLADKDDQPPLPRPERVLVVHGAEDPVLPLRVAEQSAAALGAEVAVVAGAGHYVLEESPGQAVPLVTMFLRARAAR